MSPDEPPPASLQTVDARGHRCPTPTLRLGRALSTVEVGEVVVLLADDAMARIDVPHFASLHGHAVVIEPCGAALRFSVRKGAVGLKS